MTVGSDSPRVVNVFFIAVPCNSMGTGYNLYWVPYMYGGYWYLQEAGFIINLVMIKISTVGRGNHI